MKRPHKSVWLLQGLFLSRNGVRGPEEANKSEKAKFDGGLMDYENSLSLSPSPTHTHSLHGP